MDKASHQTVAEEIEDLREKAKELIAPMGEKVQISAGRLLYAADKHPKDIYYMLKGLCALCVSCSTGKDVAVLYFSPGRLLNFLPSLERYYPRSVCPLCLSQPRGAFFVKAIDNSELLRINYKKFLEKYSSSLHLQTLIVQALVENWYDLLDMVLKSQEMPAWQRIARELLENMAGPQPQLLRKMTYNEIATHTSMHAVTVAKIFRSLQENDIIERRKGGILIKDPLRIWRIANGEERLFYKQARTGKAD